ncbi:SRPBCC family protein [Spirosoma aerolatum]|uniref:SRPBCC family protein n=1 Tax=Spirosoma aerolatum TaxID=1211326 RepID=UPI0009AD8F8C|nr:SRPBCC family protein [Spirosoma aerolatum]
MNTIAKSTMLAALMSVSGFAAITSNKATLAVAPNKSNDRSASKTMNVLTNPKAPVTCSKRIIINASPDKVWNLLANINNWASWQTDITKPSLNGPVQPGTTFDWKTGGAGIHSTLHTVEPNKSLGWTGKTFGMYAVHNWTLTEVPGGTQVAVDESMEGFLAGLFKSSFNKNLAKDMQHWLELLKAESEK